MPLPLRSSQSRKVGLAAVALIVLATGCSQSLPTSPVADPSGIQQSVGSSSLAQDNGTDEPGGVDNGALSQPVSLPELPVNTFNQPPLSQNSGHGHAYGRKKHNN
jgi:hypothetical protein